jgi:hypothetical protein
LVSSKKPAPPRVKFGGHQMSATNGSLILKYLDLKHKSHKQPPKDVTHLLNLGKIYRMKKTSPDQKFRKNENFIQAYSKKGHHKKVNNRKQMY